MWVRRIDALTEFDDGGAAPDGRLELTNDARLALGSPAHRFGRRCKKRVRSLGPKLGPCDMRLQAQKIGI